MIALSLQKAKSDNKFYAIMRTKEALDLEKKTLTRNIEKQAQTLERLLAQDKNSSNLAVRTYSSFSQKSFSLLCRKKWRRNSSCFEKPRSCKRIRFWNLTPSVAYILTEGSL